MTIPQPVRVRDRSTSLVLLTGGPSLGMLLSEVVFSGFREAVLRLHERQLAIVPTYITDMVGILLIAIAITIAKRDFKTIGGTREGRSDALKSILALLSAVIGVIVFLGGRFAGWHPGQIGILHVLAFPMLAAALILIITNRK